jgi:hypothetical protein
MKKLKNLFKKIKPKKHSLHKRKEKNTMTPLLYEYRIYRENY